MFRSTTLKIWSSLILLAFMFSALSGTSHHGYDALLVDALEHAGAYDIAMDDTCDGHETSAAAHANCYNGFVALTPLSHSRNKAVVRYEVRVPLQPTSLLRGQDFPPPKLARS